MEICINTSDENNEENEHDLGCGEDTAESDDFIDSEEDTDALLSKHEVEDEIASAVDEWLEPDRADPPVCIPPFTGPSQGYREFSFADAAMLENPVNCFLVYFQSIIELMVEDTNKCYNDYLENEVIRHPQPPVTQTDMIRFISLCIHMGHVFAASLEDYWNMPGLCHGELWGKILPRGRFSFILRFLCFEKQESFSRHTPDWLWRIRKLMNMLKESFSRYYAPSETVVVDRVLCAYKGRLFFKQDIPHKKRPNRCGVRVYKLCDARGYTVDMSIYAYEEGNDVKVTIQTVSQLVTTIEGLGHKLYMGKFFSSPELFRKMKEKKIFCCGAVHSNRPGLPVEFQKINRENLDMEEYQLEVKVTKDGLTSALYYDKRFVQILTNAHQPPEPGLYSIEIEPGRCQTVEPLMVQDFNASTGFLGNHSNQITYCLQQKTKKWTKKIFFHFLDTVVVNSFILCNSVSKGKKELTLDRFRIELIEGLILRCELGPSQSPSWQTDARLSARHSIHWPKERASRGNCVVCHRAGLKKRTKVYCQACNMRLCLQPCFQNYHTLLTY